MKEAIVPLKQLANGTHLVAMLTSGVFSLLVTTVHARSSHDGQWNITFFTQRGECSPTYSYTINIEDGVITQPNLASFRGSVTKNGAVHASVSVQDKRASGTGKLANASGRGTWSGYSGGERCAGYWTAQRAW